MYIIIPVAPTYMSRLFMKRTVKAQWQQDVKVMGNDCFGNVTEFIAKRQNVLGCQP